MRNSQSHHTLSSSALLILKEEDLLGGRDYLEKGEVVESFM
jgi:hypothetical protein